MRFIVFCLATLLSLGTTAAFAAAPEPTTDEQKTLYALGDECPVALGRHMPVDGADVVAVLVGAYVIELQAAPLEDGMEIPLHLAVDGLAYLDLVSAQFLEEFSHRGFILGR